MWTILKGLLGHPSNLKWNGRTKIERCMDRNMRMRIKWKIGPQNDNNHENNNNKTNYKSIVLFYLIKLVKISFPVPHGM